MLKLKKNEKLIFAGAGRLGSSVLKSALNKKSVKPSNCLVWTRTKKSSEKISKEFKVNAVSRKTKAHLENARAIIVGVKPYQLKEFLDELKSLGLKSETLIISLVAGVDLKDWKKLLSKNPVAIAMCNTAAKVSESMTFVLHAKKLSSVNEKFVYLIFNSAGKTLPLKNSSFNEGTIMGASLPAYVLLLLETLEEEAAAWKLPKSSHKALFSQVLRGVADMYESSSKSPRFLMDQIATPGGCTREGLNELEKKNTFKKIFKGALRKAVKKAGALA